MSSFSIPVTEIREILPIENANALEVAKVFDWEVVVQKGRYKPGDKVIYVPVDSILPWNLEQMIFPPESKIKLRKSRIRSIKLRGQISQGMILDIEEAESYLQSQNISVALSEYDEVSTMLGITKYEPPTSEMPGFMQVKPKKKKGNPEFKKYTDIENFKYYDRMFADDEQVYISEKLHGTSFRAGWFPMVADTLWKKVKKLFGKLPEWEFCWGLRTVQIQVKGSHSGVQIESQGVNFDDVYTKMVKQYGLKTMIPVGWAVYGEIVGDGIQKDYSYGCGRGEHKLYLYDVMVNGQWLDYDKFKEATSIMSLDTVPSLYVGPFSKEIADKLRDGDSTIKGQKVREGVVIKPVIENVCSIGRKVLKYVSDAYYLRDNTDFH